MGDFPCIRHDDNKTLSHKIIKGGIVRVGTLVKNEQYGTLGIIMEMVGEEGAYIAWLTTPSLDPLWHTCYLEVLCE